jgi:hypothetical protein
MFPHDQSSFALDLLQNGNKGDANTDHGGIFAVSSPIALIVSSMFRALLVWVFVTAIGNAFLSFPKTENKDISG